MTMPHHALEVVLTRPARPAELRTATRSVPLAANCDGTRLMALCPGKTARRAAHRLRQHLGSLPVDVITAHYPDQHGQVLLNIAWPPTTQAALRRTAEKAGQSLEQMLEQTLRRALDQHDRDETERLRRAVTHLLTGTTPAHLLTALGHALARTPGAAP
ncbi:MULTISPECIES: hypothetical protein [Streptomyces]|uniref:hypothetical protein n=1 Tax=Streptomyces TaxID=1883 RepID=UPI0003A22358|nr:MULTISPECIES: hypothetical protein [Streptomyces]MBZ6114210.1 hypothetical protein [Streptomyces olivaceus]MBZ6128315.1 hypothetical protein [Streptomyces olivaceus]MBZ6148842.1 hypothetical protein [Streptomyces olivaceus]MBZ6163079.1 hypothetical protein [Streptomyces olivaceus]MBZ6190883.1 hypothetical protein [Streptomyces olivaceus]